MLFRKNIDPCCAYCCHSGPMSEDSRTCLKRGIVPATGSCRKFVYDPLKRIPPRPAAPNLRKWTEEDFRL